MTTPSEAPIPTLPRRRHGLLRWLLWPLLALVLLLALLIGGILVWAGSDGSLATALRLAGGHLPLTAQSASGAILGGSHIDQLVWDQDGIRVEVEDAVLDWQPHELLDRKLHIRQLSAARIIINDQSAPKEKSSSPGLPDSLVLPFGLRIAVDSVHAGEVLWKGPPAQTIRDVDARFNYDGRQYVLDLLGASYKSEDYQATLQARATAGAQAPVQLSATASGAATALLPDTAEPVLAALQVHVSGTLADMLAQVRVQAAPAAGNATLQRPPLPDATAQLQTEPNLDWPGTSAAPPTRLDAEARITPQEKLPLQEVVAELHALDLHAFLPQAPTTDLAAQLNVTPQAASAPGGSLGWVLHAKLANARAGPWDAQQLPVDRVTAAATWQDGIASVQNLLVELADGRVEADGQWHSDTASWQVNSQITHVNPALLHSDLAAFAIDGSATASGQDADVDFDIALNAADNDAVADDRQKTDELADQLRALALRQVSAQGHFAGGLLTLPKLFVQTDDATLAGRVKANLADMDALTLDTDLKLDAPGLQVAAKGELAADSGSGTVNVNLSDAAATLAWAQKLPGAADVLAGAQAKGSARLDAHWQGGWRDPQLQARLDAPSLDVTPPAEGIDAIQLRALQGTASGRLAQAKLQLQGRVLQPAQQVDLKLALDAEGGWADHVLSLDRLQLDAGDASAAGHARIALADTSAFKADTDLQIKAPGLTGNIKGQLAPKTGDGAVALNLSDAAATLRWAKTLPGAADALAGARASGTARLDANWQGGLQNPNVHGALAIPSLDYNPRDKEAALAIRNLQGQLDGTLAQAQLTTTGRILQGKRQIDLELAADGGRSNQDASAWHLRLSQLAAQLQAPELGAGQWQITSSNAIPISWNPAAGGQLDVAAGQLTITSPAPSTESRIIWEPLRWHGGELTSAGRITDLPLAWAQRVAGEQLEDAGISGDIVLGAQWDIQMGRALKLNARIERVSGDLNVRATDNGSGTSSSIPAGLHQALAEVSSNGNDVHLNIQWDSERAGNVDGVLSTRLSASRGTNGKSHWSWSKQAPLQGRLKAELPEISVWSLLAPPGWRLHGSLSADAQISGSAAQPQVAGTLSADDLALRSVVDGLQFEDGRLRAHLQDTRLIIDEFVLHGPGDDDSGGSIRVTGEAGLVDGQPGAQVQAIIDKLHASVRDDRDMVASGKIAAGLQGRTVSAKGTLSVDRAHIILPDESRPSLSDDVVIHGLDKDDDPVEQKKTTDRAQAAEADAQKAKADAEHSPLHADIAIKIDLGEDFQIDGMGIDTRLAGTLELTANGPLAEMPTLKGRVETVGGTFRAYGQQLNIEHGRVFFAGDVSNPSLDILALRPNYTSDQKVGALVQGTALLPQVKLYSEPTLPDDQVLAWLILGHAAPEDGGEAAMMQTAALALLGGRDSEGLASSFGLDELSFGGGGNGEGLSGTSVTLGKRLSDRLYTAYEHSLSGTGGVLMIFYELSRRWVLRGQASENSAVDLIYRLSYD